MAVALEVLRDEIYKEKEGRRFSLVTPSRNYIHTSTDKHELITLGSAITESDSRKVIKQPLPKSYF